MTKTREVLITNVVLIVTYFFTRALLHSNQLLHADCPAVLHLLFWFGVDGVFFIFFYNLILFIRHKCFPPKS